MNQQSPLHGVIAGLLRVALVAALVGAGWSIYRKLPQNGSTTAINGAGAGATETALLIVLRRSPEDDAAAVNIPVELYSIDIRSARNEFFSERRAGMRFDDFLAQRMKERPPVTARLDEHGQTTVMVMPGKWWIHAVLVGAQNVEWHLPVNVAGRQQTVELTPENAYARTKSF